MPTFLKLTSQDKEELKEIVSRKPTDIFENDKAVFNYLRTDCTK